MGRRGPICWRLFSARVGGFIPAPSASGPLCLSPLPAPSLLMRTEFPSWLPASTCRGKGSAREKPSSAPFLRTNTTVPSPGGLTRAFPAAQRAMGPAGLSTGTCECKEPPGKAGSTQRWGRDLMLRVKGLGDALALNKFN